MASAICTFSRMPFDISFSRIDSSMPKDPMSSRARSGLKSSKKSAKSSMQELARAPSGRKLMSGRNDTSAFDSGPGARPAMVTCPS
jgi:hypothetical protein